MRQVVDTGAFTPFSDGEFTHAEAFSKGASGLVTGGCQKKDPLVYEDSKVENGKIYYYKVRATDPGGIVPCLPLCQPSLFLRLPLLP